jgi:hypothetical protein
MVHRLLGENVPSPTGKSSFRPASKDIKINNVAAKDFKCLYILLTRIW